MSETKIQWIKRIYDWYILAKDQLQNMQESAKSVEDTYTDEQKLEVYTSNIDFYTAVKLFLENNAQLMAMLPPPPPPPDEDE